MNDAKSIDPGEILSLVEIIGNDLVKEKVEDYLLGDRSYIETDDDLRHYLSGVLDHYRGVNPIAPDELLHYLNILNISLKESGDYGKKYGN